MISGPGGRTGHGPTSRRGGRGLRALAPVLGLIVLFVISAGPAGGGSGPGPATPAAGAAAGALGFHHAASPAIGAAAPAGYPSRGGGVFLRNATIPFPATGGHELCLPSTSPTFNGCYNMTVEPTVTALHGGTMDRAAVAYTAFTNATSCAALAGTTVSAIGFSRTLDAGANWSTPKYLGPSGCSSPNSLFPDAWQPSMATLANGTLVLAYIQLNLSYGSSVYLPPYVTCAVTTFNRLVLTESYDNGATWTVPTVLANGTVPSSGSCATTGTILYHPSVATTGKTIYVAYQNTSDPLNTYLNGNEGAGTGGLVVSTNGGAAWSAPILIRPVRGNWYNGYHSNITLNPRVAVAPSGRVLVSFVTEVNTSQTYYNGYWNGSYYGYYGYNTSGHLYEALSSNNGTTLSYLDLGTVGIGTLGGFSGYPPTPNDAVQPTSPEVAFDPSGSGRAYLVYAATTYGDYCYPTPNSGIPPCPATHALTVYVRTSSNNGSTWSSAQPIAPAFANAPNATVGYQDTPSVAVASNGTVFVQFAYTNGSLCEGPGYGAGGTAPCGPRVEYLTSSGDGGGTFARPVALEQQGIVGTDFNGGPLGPFWYYGEYSALVTTPTNVFSAYTTEDCLYPGSTTSCAYYGTSGSYGRSRLVVSYVDKVPGITLTLTPSGLPAGAGWSAVVGGNWRTNATGGSLVVSGVPAKWPVAIFVPWDNVSYGNAYVPSTPYFSGNFSASSTITVTFHELLRVHLESNPAFAPAVFSGYCAPPCYFSTLNVTPLPPYTQWVAPGTKITMSETWSLPTTTSYIYYYNITFVSWSGTGPGSVTSNASTIVVRMSTGPVNETIYVELLQYCDAYSTGRYCTNLDYPLSFRESGLPSGTKWELQTTVNRQTSSTTSTSASLSFTVPDVPVSYLAWTVPGPNGQFYEPSYPMASPVTLPVNGSVPVLYTLEDAANASLTANLSTTGLPGGARYSVTIGSVSYGGYRTSVVPVPGGVSLALSSAPVLYSNGTGYVATTATITPLVVNALPSTINLPGNVTFNGSARIQLHYVPEYLLTIRSNAGGTVSPSTEWVVGGTRVTLNASAGPGYFFVGWQGTGSGATGGPQTYQAITNITPAGPVTEVATFRPVPPPTWNVTFVESGLPGGTPFQFDLGGVPYGGYGTVRIGLLATGDYAISAGTVTSNATNGTRFVLGSLETTLPYAAPHVLDIAANGTVWLNYTLEYALVVQASSFGTVSPGVGTFWEPAGTVVPLTAVPDRFTAFVGWNGTGVGGVRSTQRDIEVTVNGAITETAGFVRLPTPPTTTFGLAVHETGLPEGLTWSVVMGAIGASGSGPTVTVPGLNGSYAVSVAPVLAGPGDRWVATVVGGSNVTVVANATLNVTFAEEFRLLLLAGAGGAVAGGGWYPAGTTATATATPLPGERFLGWTGSGAAGTDSGSAQLSIPMSGPANETAAFGAVPVVAASQPGGLAGLTTGLGLLVVLAVVGIGLGYVLAGRRRGPPPEEAGWDDAEAPSGAETIEAPAESLPEPAWTEEPPATPSAGSEEWSEEYAAPPADDAPSPPDPPDVYPAGDEGEGEEMTWPSTYPGGSGPRESGE